MGHTGKRFNVELEPRHLNFEGSTCRLHASIDVFAQTKIVRHPQTGTQRTDNERAEPDHKREASSERFIYLKTDNNK